MGAYEALAASYDRLTNDVDYGAIVAFYEEILKKEGLKPRTAVDLACGTGSCATVAALVLRGVCPRNVPVDVHLLGGILSITITADDDILMTGPAETAFVACVEV